MIGNDHFDEWIRKRWSGGGYGGSDLHPAPAPLVAVLGLAGETGESIDLILDVVGTGHVDREWHIRAVLYDADSCAALRRRLAAPRNPAA